MCGIAGVVTDSAETSAQLCKQLLSQLRHRGIAPPKSESVGSASLGCVRLPIVNRHIENQPVLDRDLKQITVLNGEIYNWRHLESYLSTQDQSTLGGDAPIVQRVIGSRSSYPTDLEGMFAAGHFDSKLDLLTLVRDPVGIKPLYYSTTENKTAFASERKAFAGTEFRLVQEVAPGTVLNIRSGEVVESVSFEWPSAESSDSIDEEWSARLREILTKAIIRQIPEDLPVAVLCSGGVDSGILLAVVAEETKKRNIERTIGVYVAGISADSPDVSAARALCGHLGLDCKFVPLHPTSLLNSIAHVVRVTESFNVNVVRNSIVSHAIFRKIRSDNFRVALCGEGADELFFGYGDFLNQTSSEGQIALMKSLLRDLHLTQLLRVDRTSMQQPVETRVPYLDNKVIDLALRIPPELKVNQSVKQTKVVLRNAFADMLPREIIERPKATLAYGAGFSSLRDAGPIEEKARTLVSNSDLRLMRRAYPELQIDTHEKALYLRYFLDHYEIPVEYEEPITAKIEIERQVDTG